MAKRKADGAGEVSSSALQPRLPPVPLEELQAAQIAILKVLRNVMLTGDGQVEIACWDLSSKVGAEGHSLHAVANAIVSFVEAGLLERLDGVRYELGNEYLEYREWIEHPIDIIRSTPKLWKWKPPAARTSNSHPTNGEATPPDESDDGDNSPPAPLARFAIELEKQGKKRSATSRAWFEKTGKCYSTEEILDAIRRYKGRHKAKVKPAGYTGF
jgi:hypothetical protein